MIFYTVIYIFSNLYLVPVLNLNFFEIVCPKIRHFPLYLLDRQSIITMQLSNEAITRRNSTVAKCSKHCKLQTINDQTHQLFP